MTPMSLPEDIERLNREFDEARTADQSRWYDFWDETYKYMAPSRQRRAHIHSVEAMMKHIRDSTGMDALQSLAQNIISAAMPQWSSWAMLAPHDMIQPTGPDDNTRDQLIEMLEPVNAVIGTMLAQSNFYAALVPFTEDFIIGTGAMGLFDKGGGRLRARYYSPFEYSFNTDISGNPLHVYIENNIQPAALVALAEERGNPFPEDVVEEKLGPSKRIDRLCLRQIIYPEGNKFREVLYVKDAGLQHVLSDSYVDYHPIFISRWALDADNRHGVGPGATVASDVKFVNKLKEHGLDNMMLQTTGVYTAVDDGVLNAKNVRVRPGSVIPVMSNDNTNPSLRPLPIATNLELAQFEVNVLRQDIRKQLFSDRFSNYGDSKLSPTEVIMRAQQLARELGPAYSQLQKEFMEPIIRAVVTIGQKNGNIPRGIELDSGALQITYTSQLEQAQRLGRVQNITQMMQTAASMVEIDRNASMVIDHAEAVRQLAEATQVPTSIVRSREALKQLAQNAAENAAAIGQQNAQIAGEANGGTNSSNT